MRVPRPSSAVAPALTRILTGVALVLLGLLGPVLFVVGTVGVQADASLERDGARVTGTVTSFADAQRHTRRDVRVSYVADDGIERTVVVNADHDQHPAPGQPVQVVYDPSDPERAVVAGLDSTWQPVMGLGLILSALTLGIVVAVGVGGAVRRSRRARARIG